MIGRYIQGVLNPEVFHGSGKKPPFFEGWYIKLISADEAHRYAIIPGIFLSDDPKKHHAFVQVLDGLNGIATYHTFPAEQFVASGTQFNARVGENHFTKDSVTLNIADDQLTLRGEVQFEGLTDWPVQWHTPGAMGWYAWVPIMECYHGVVSLNHRISGALEINGKQIDFSGGIGYMEKDWGKSFPSGYVWMQTNHFEQPNTSLVATAAMVPFIGRTFPGLLCGFYHNGKLYRMASYTGAEIEQLTITDEQVDYTLRDKTHRIRMQAERTEGGLLLGPSREEMHKRVNETLKSRVHLQLSTLDGKILFEGTGRNAGLEVHGDTAPLLTK